MDGVAKDLLRARADVDIEETFGVPSRKLR
jgi:hypothetical protein